MTGQTILVQGAGGAVAHFAVQFAAIGGARVIGTAGSDERAAHARSAGAEAVIDRIGEDVAARVMDLTGGAGVDRIIETDFGANLETDIAVLKQNGVIASYSSTSAPEPVLPYYAFGFKGANVRFIQGFALPGAARAAGVSAITDLAANGRLEVALGEWLPLDQIAKAHELVEQASVVGNVVLEIV